MKRIIFATALLCASLSAYAQHSLQMDNGAGGIVILSSAGLLPGITNYTFPPTSGELLVDAGGGSITINGATLTWPANAAGFLYNNGAGLLSWSPTGTVTNFSFTDGGGFTGNVTNATTTPALSLTLQNAAADGSTKGQASFSATDFDATAGNISIDYTNGQAASGSTKGFLTSADWTTFNSKVSSVTGTANRITIGGTSTNPTVDVSASYVGQNTITTLGTIGTGVWNGTIVTPTYGGTGVNGSAAANGSLLIGNGSGYSLATLTAGSGTTITNGAGTITVSAGPSALRTSLATYALKNLSATAANVLLDLDPSGSITLNEIVIPYSGYIVGISVASNAARTSGTATFEIYVNNVGTGLTVVLNGTNTQYNFTTQASGLDAFAAGDKISIKCTTVGWGPTSADVVVLPIIEY